MNPDNPNADKTLDQSQARANEALDRAADALAPFVGGQQRAYSLLRWLLVQPSDWTPLTEPAAAVEACFYQAAILGNPDPNAAERARSQVQLPDVTGWTCRQAAVQLSRNEDAQIFGQVLLDRISRALGCGYQPTLLGTLSSPAVSQHRQRLDVALAAFCRMNPSASFDDLVGGLARRVSGRGGYLVPFVGLTGWRDLRESAEAWAAWLNDETPAAGERIQVALD